MFKSIAALVVGLTLVAVQPIAEPKPAPLAMQLVMICGEPWAVFIVWPDGRIDGVTGEADEAVLLDLLDRTPKQNRFRANLNHNCPN